MLLVIDIGNTNIVFGVHNGQEWGKIFRIQTDPDKTADEYEVIFRSLFTSNKVCKSDISKVIISSVVPVLVRSFSEMILNLNGFDAIIVNPDYYGKLPIKILNPFEIGTDLVANATAAYSTFKPPLMIIDFGTALTFTTIGEEGEILGVAIAPGLHTAVKSLAGNTAQLPPVQLTKPPSVLGKNTIHAIQAGIVYGFTGLVNSMIEQTELEIGTGLNVVATGGLANVLVPMCAKINCIEENLTLEGLKCIAEIVTD